VDGQEDKKEKDESVEAADQAEAVENVEKDGEQQLDAADESAGEPQKDEELKEEKDAEKQSAVLNVDEASKPVPAVVLVNESVDLSGSTPPPTSRDLPTEVYTRTFTFYLLACVRIKRLRHFIVY